MCVCIITLVSRLFETLVGKYIHVHVCRPMLCGVVNWHLDSWNSCLNSGLVCMYRSGYSSSITLHSIIERRNVGLVPTPNM